MVSHGKAWNGILAISLCLENSSKAAWWNSELQSNWNYLITKIIHNYCCEIIKHLNNITFQPSPMLCKSFSSATFSCARLDVPRGMISSNALWFESEKCVRLIHVPCTEIRKRKTLSRRHKGTKWIRKQLTLRVSERRSVLWEKSELECLFLWSDGRFYSLRPMLSVR